MKSKTVDQRVDALMNTLPYLHKSPGGVAGFRERLRTALQEVAAEARASRQPVPERPQPEPPYHGEAFLAALMNFELSRRQARKPMTSCGREALYRKIAEWNNEAMATQALEESTANGWQGVFVPRSTNGNGRPSRVDISLAATRELLAESEAERNANAR